MSRAISIHAVSFINKNQSRKSPPSKIRALFSMQRSLHDSTINIYNHSFNIGYGLEILRAAPPKRLNYPENVVNEGRGMV